MTEGRSLTAREAVEGVLASEHADVLRESVALMVREIMELEVGQPAGAELGERAPERRTAQRNGYRERRWDTRVGEIELQIPRLRTGSYLPSFCITAPDAQTLADQLALILGEHMAPEDEMHLTYNAIQCGWHHDPGRDGWRGRPPHTQLFFEHSALLVLRQAAAQS